MKLKFALAAAVMLAALPVMAQTPSAGRGATGGSSQAPAASAPAQTPSSTPSASTVDPAKAAAVKQLMQLTGAGKLGEEYMDLITTRVRQVMANAIPQPDRLQQFMDAFSKNLTTRVTAAQVDDAEIPIYAEHLSLEDIQALVAFYQTPAGQHVIKALPLIIQEAQNAGANMVQPAAIETLKSMATEYPEVEDVLPKEGTVPGAAPAQPQLRQIPTQQ
jgi:hypothetical protein